MAGNQVSARMEGDMYQGMFFWRHASFLLNPTSKVCQVDLEHDAASHVDDIAVFYDAPGKMDCGKFIQAEHFQIKYHVDRTKQYSSDALLDPTFINAKTSLLQRSRRAYDALNSAGRSGFTLGLASNGTWDSSDHLGPSFRESDGRLPADFFTDSSGGRLGQIREKWRVHLGFNDDSAFQAFLRSLRVKCDYFGRRDFQELVDLSLQQNGLLPYSKDGRGSLYESLILRFITDGTRSFSRESFRQMCQSEGLLNTASGTTPRQPSIGIRSFMRFAERMEDDCDPFVCLGALFEGRYPRASTGWDTHITSKVVDFFANPLLRAELRRTGHHLHLDCHSSLALLAGYELDRKSGASVWPIQKGIVPSAWTPTGVTDPSWAWNVSTIFEGGAGDNLGLALSATHDIQKDVAGHLDRHREMFRKVVSLTVNTGNGPLSIRSADHAVKLADEAMQSIRNLRQTCGGSTLHLWCAAPNALLFYLGQHREALGDLQLYEFDFSGAKGGGYSSSIRLPYGSTK